MSTHKQKLDDVNKRLMGLYKADQKSMIAFKSLSDTVVREGKVSSSMKELIAVSIAEAKKHGADRDTVVEVLAIAIEMSGGPGTVYAAKALDVFDNL